MALAGCSQVIDSIGRDTIRVIVPDGYNPTDGANLVVYHHGVSDSNQGLNVPVIEPTVQAWVDAGYLAAASDAAGDNWGNDAGLSAYLALDSYLRERYTVGRVVIYSGSMGGVSGLLMAASDRIAGLAGWIGIFPVCSLASMFRDNTGALADSIRAAYQVANDGSDYAARTAGHDPLLLGSGAYPDIPFRFYASPADSVVNKAANSDAMLKLISGRRMEATVVATSGDHGDPSNFRANDVADFLKRCFAANNLADSAPHICPCCTLV